MEDEAESSSQTTDTVSRYFLIIRKVVLGEVWRKAGPTPLNSKDLINFYVSLPMADNDQQSADVLSCKLLFLFGILFVGLQLITYVNY